LEGTGGTIKQSKAEQSRAKQSKAEQSRAKQSWRDFDHRVALEIGNTSHVFY
jgi:hypothetical protein